MKNIIRKKSTSNMTLVSNFFLLIKNLKETSINQMKEKLELEKLHWSSLKGTRIWEAFGGAILKECGAHWEKPSFFRARLWSLGKWRSLSQVVCSFRIFLLSEEAHWACSARSLGSQIWEVVALKISREKKYCLYVLKLEANMKSLSTIEVVYLYIIMRKCLPSYF